MNKLKVKNEKYIDVTEEWLKNAKPNSHKVEEQPYFDYQGIRYFVDGKNVVLDYSKEELEMAKWLENTFGGEIYMLPRINIPKGIKTADYLWNNRKFDLKTLNGKSKRIVDNTLKNKKSQADSFILKFSHDLASVEIIEQAKKIYNTYHREWIDIIVIVQNYKIWKIFKRKK